MTPARTLSLLCLSALLAAGCETATQSGFSVPGCYDYGHVLEPSIPTAAECHAVGWQWYTEDWKKKVPAKPPARSIR